MKPADAFDVLAAITADGFVACSQDDGDGTLLMWIAHDRRLHAFFDAEGLQWSYWTTGPAITLDGPYLIDDDPVPTLRDAMAKLKAATP